MTNSIVQMSPFRIEPRASTRPWGFRDLRPWYDRVAEGEPIGEMWLTGDDCLVATGPFAGRRLADLFADAHTALLGPDAPSPDSPLLIKVIFAREKLSVQVHPDDRMAQKYGDPRGKTECWYVLAAEPGAKLALGVKPGTTLADLERGIREVTLETSLNLLPVVAGEMVFVDAGTLHAIWPGLILLETQQNCDLTYRMYDYGRPRPIHIERSLEAVRMTTRAGRVAPQALADRTLLIDKEYFRVEKIAASGSHTSASLRATETKPSFAYLFAAAGAGRLTGEGFDPLDLPPHGIVAIPASSPEFVLEDASAAGQCLELIRIVPNWPSPAAG